MVEYSTALFIAFIAVVVAVAAAIALPGRKPKPREEGHDNVFELLDRIEWRLDAVTRKVSNLKNDIKKK